MFLTARGAEGNIKFVIHPLLRPLVTSLSVIPFALAQSDVNPVNADAILKEIETIEQKQKQTIASAKNSTLSRLQTAAASGAAAAGFYTDAVEEVQFQGQKGKAEAFIDWKKQNGDLLRSKPMQTALMLHLRYALLAVQRKGIEKPETLMPASEKYLSDLIAADDVFEDKPPQQALDLLTKPLGQSVMAQWLRLGDWLPDDKDFELAPGNVTGILNKNIRPYLREAKSPNLIQTWDLQMQIEADRITTGRSDHKADEFNSVTRPRLIFQRAKDMATIGQPNRAVSGIIVLVRTYPEHPDFNTWVAEIKSMVKPPATAPAPAETSPQ